MLRNLGILERNYILSMVYNMGKADLLREETEFAFNSSSYIVGGETNKSVLVTDDKVEKTCRGLKVAINNNKIEVIPDLVIHDSHNPEAGNTGKGQYLILEAKTTKRLGEYYFMRDFFKLNLYLAEFHFHNAVFLLIKKSAKTIDDYIDTYKKKDFYCSDELKCKFRLFIQEKDTPEIFKLK